MALQIRRGTDAERQLFIPLQGEIIFTTDTKKLYVGDGTTLGGVAVDTAGGGGGEPDGNTTYGISAETVSGGANLRLTGSDASTDNVKLAAGSNVTISRTNADTITIAATGDGGAVQLNELTDVVITGTPTTGQVLKYDGTNWINDTDATGGGGSATTLDELTDVVITGTPSTGQVLKYDGTNWVNGTDNVGGGGGGATVLDELTDVIITGTPTLDQVLKYDGTDWVNGEQTVPAVGDLTDVVITGTPSIGQVLKYDGTNWVNGAEEAAVLNIDSLTDVGINDVLGGDILRYDSGTQNWLNSALALESLDDIFIDPLTSAIGDSLIFNGTTWVNGTPAMDITDLNDVVLNPGTLATGQLLVYDGTNWVNEFTALDDLNDVAIDGLTVTADQVLKYNGFGWVNSDLNLADLADVSYSVLVPNSILLWDGTGWTADGLQISTDLSPQLGGTLDLNGFDITGTGNISIVGDLTASVVDTSQIYTEFGVSISAPLVGKGLTLEGIARPGDIPEISIQSSRGTLVTPGDGLAGDLTGRYTIKGYSEGGYKDCVIIRGRWQPDADLTKTYPKSALHFVLNNNTDIPNAGISAAVRGDGVLIANVHLATAQTTANINTNYPTPEAGMIVFDSTLQKFKGWVTDTGLAGGGASNSTPGWVNLN